MEVEKRQRLFLALNGVSIESRPVPLTVPFSGECVYYSAYSAT